MSGMFADGGIQLLSDDGFIAQIASAKAASIEYLPPGHGFSMIVTDAGNVNLIDAMIHVERNFPGCDRRRRKREIRKSLAKARVESLPRHRVIAGPITWQDRNHRSPDQIVMTGPIDFSGAADWVMMP